MATIAPVMDDVLVADPVDFAEPAVLVAPPAHEAIPALERALAARLGAARYDLWFAGKARLSLYGNTLQIAAANAFAANWIRSKFLGEAAAAARAVLGHDVQVAVTVAAETTSAPAGEPAPIRPTPSAVSSPKPQIGGTPLCQKYTFEEFVVGPSNQLACHAAQRLASGAAHEFNPLFLHGACGLGKTHLLQAICHRFAASAGPTPRRFLYLTGEQFTNEFLEALRQHKTEAFRRRLRCADLLVIDDIHFLANKKATQEEFLHTFNQIDAHGKLVVLASDAAPRQIAALAEPLVSRFLSGMVLRIDPPDLPTRLEILRRRVARHHYQLSDSVLMHIAQTATASVRELEGLLLQVVAGLSLTPHPTGTTVAESLQQHTGIGAPPIAIDRILAAVATHFGLTPAALTSRTRGKTISLARSLALYLARKDTGMSYPELGRAFGNKNHSTAIAACQRIETLLANSEVLHWNDGDRPGSPRHQTAPDLVHELEAALRKRL